MDSCVADWEALRAYERCEVFLEVCEECLASAAKPVCVRARYAVGACAAEQADVYDCYEGERSN